MSRMAKGRKAQSRMNGDELEYERLFLSARPHGFEDIKLRIGDNAFYRPDYWTLGEDDVLEFHEVKGFWREAARVRIRCAAERYPWFRFVAVTRRPKAQGGGWVRERFGLEDAA